MCHCGRRQPPTSSIPFLLTPLSAFLIEDGSNGDDAVNLLTEIDRDVRLESREERYQFLNDHKPKCEELAARLGQPVDKRHGNSELWVDLAKEPAQNHRKTWVLFFIPKVVWHIVFMVGNIPLWL